MKAALAERASPEFRDADEKLREARAAAQVGAWSCRRLGAWCCRRPAGGIEGQHAAARGRERYHLPLVRLPPVCAACLFTAALSRLPLPASNNADTPLLQGGRWMDEGNMPAGLPSQRDQPDVRGALERAQDPAVKASGLQVGCKEFACTVVPIWGAYGVACMAGGWEMQESIAALPFPLLPFGPSGAAVTPHAPSIARPLEQEEMERKRAARAAAQGGRWLD